MRDKRIDLLRFIGLMMIILAHVQPPGIIFQLRNFDVPLMVIVSGMAFALGTKKQPYNDYLKSRAQRLIAPVWIFLTIYFSFIAITGYPKELKITTELLTESYLLYGGIGYVWIIKVFLLVAIISPLIKTKTILEKSNKNILTAALGLFLAYELLLYYAEPNKQIFFISEIVFYLIPYSLIFIIGTRLASLSRQEINYLLVLSLSIFAIAGALIYTKYGKIIPTQNYKYPPQLYYVSYAIFVSTFLFSKAELIVEKLEKFNKFKTISFISKNSIWIYLWHIPIVMLSKEKFYITYIVALALPITITYLQVKSVENLSNRLKSEKIKRTLINCLTG